MQEESHEKVIEKALKCLGLMKLRKDDRSKDFFTIVDKEKRQYDCYGNELNWKTPDLDDIYEFGKIKFFVCLFEKEIENPFYGVNTVEELEMKIDLLDVR